jgi:hypothetical protein
MSIHAFESRCARARATCSAALCTLLLSTTASASERETPIAVQISSAPIAEATVANQAKQQERRSKINALPYTVLTQTVAEIMPDGSVRTHCLSAEKAPKNFLTDALPQAEAASAQSTAAQSDRETRSTSRQGAEPQQ